MIHVLHAMVLCLATGFGGDPIPPGGLLDKWSGMTPNPDYQICNLSNGGLILSHDLNTGNVILKGSMWRQLSGKEQSALERMLQNYQNRNARKTVTLHTDGESVTREPLSQSIPVSAPSAPSYTPTPAAPTPGAGRLFDFSGSNSSPASALASGGGALRVLCVEDVETHARQLRDAMAGTRIELLAAPNLATAYDWLAKHHADVMVLAVNRPADAQATIDRARTLALRMPVVVIAGFENDAIRRDAITRGFQDYAQKTDLNVAMLQSMIENSVDRFRARSAAMPPLDTLASGR